MTIFTRSISFVIAGLNAWAHLQSTVPLSRIIESSSSIFVASGQWTREGNHLIGTLRVERSFKGDLAAGTVITLRPPFTGNYQKAPATFANHTRWLCSMEGKGDTAIIRRTNPIAADDICFPLKSQPAETANANSPVESIVAFLTLEVIRHPDSLILLSDTVEPVADAAMADRIGAIVSSVAASETRDPVDAIIALDLRLSRTEALAKLEKRLAGQVPPSMVISFTSLLRTFYWNPDPAGIETLGRILKDQSQSIFLRRSAVSTLFHLRTADTVPVLEACLDDADEDVVETAVGALSTMANGSPGYGPPFIVNGKAIPRPTTSRFAATVDTRGNSPDHQTFPANKERLKTFWKRWAAEHRKDLQPRAIPE